MPKQYFFKTQNKPPAVFYKKAVFRNIAIFTVIAIFNTVKDTAVFD